jgi:hypothetical protein
LLGAGNLRKFSTERGLAPDGLVFDDVDTAERTISRGEFVLVVDDERREDEGELIVTADADTLPISHSWCANQRYRLHGGAGRHA